MTTPNKRIRPLFIFVALLSTVAACEELPLTEKEETTRDFTIPAGEHYASPRLLETVETRAMAFRATFDNSAKYELSDASLQSNINKLMGFSDCNAHHHENSARFGWCWYDNRLEIHAYCYVDSLRVQQLLAVVNPNEENLYEVKAESNQYTFFVNGEKKTEIPRTARCEEGLSYKLYPYFGGSAPAPHDVHIKIEMVE